MRLFRGLTSRALLGVLVALNSTSWSGAAPLPATAAPTAGLASSAPALQSAYGRLPLHFEANAGQTDPRVKFVARGPGYTVFLTSTEAALVLGTRTADRARRDETVIRLTLRGAASKPAVKGLDELPGTANYFIGNDPGRWRSNIPTYARVRYRDVYPGVDLVYYGAGRRLEHDFVVAPGADPGVIRLSVAGTGQLSLDRAGDLVLHARGADLRLRKPLIYQESRGTRRMIAGGYELTGARLVAFRVGAYDASKPLVIDPVLDYSTYLGGSGDDAGNGIAVDSAGNAYITGSTSSVNFPTANALDPTLGGGQDAFVTKLNAAGSALIYSTYLGGTASALGNGSDFGTAIAVDAAGKAYVVGATRSSNFPVTAGAMQIKFGGNQDAFVAKLSEDGSRLLYSTYLGGESFDFGTGIALDTTGNVYVTGITGSTLFPTTVTAFQGTLSAGPNNAFVTKLDTTAPALTALVYSTYLGGKTHHRSIGDSGNAIAVDQFGNVYVTGATDATDFPTTAGVIQPTLAGGQNAFVSKIDPSQSGAAGLRYSTYLGGTFSDGGSGIAVDVLGNAYLTGSTNSTDFPTTSGAFQTTFGGADDAFITKLNPSGSALVYSTYLGGTGFDECDGIAVDGDGNAYVTGVTSSANFPTVDPIQSALRGVEDAFVARLNATGSALTYSTYLGGTRDVSGVGDSGNAIAVDAAGNAYVTGATPSSDFPTLNAFQRVAGGGVDAFVAKIVADSIPPTTTAKVSPEPVNGWNTADVTVMLTATDNVGGSGVREIDFSLAGAQTGSGVQAGSTVSVPITAEGKTTLSYFAVDNAGNQESPKMLTVRIDKTPPTMTCSANPSTLWPPDHRMVPVTTAVAITDLVSSPARFILISAMSNEPDNGQGDGDTTNDIQGFGADAPTVGLLRAERSGSGTGRVYTLSYRGFNEAGLSATCNVTVTVPHDQSQ